MKKTLAYRGFNLTIRLSIIPDKLGFITYDMVSRKAMFKEEGKVKADKSLWVLLDKENEFKQIVNAILGPVQGGFVEELKVIGYQKL